MADETKVTTTDAILSQAKLWLENTEGVSSREMVEALSDEVLRLRWIIESAIEASRSGFSKGAIIRTMVHHMSKTSDEVAKDAVR